MNYNQQKNPYKTTSSNPKLPVIADTYHNTTEIKAEARASTIEYSQVLSLPSFKDNQRKIDSIPSFHSNQRELLGRGITSILLDDNGNRSLLSTNFPYNCICSLEIYRNNTLSWGTGFMINKRCVVTAGHNVFDEGHWSNKIIVRPGGFGSLSPLGEDIFKCSYSVEGWTINNNSDYDYGAVILPSDKLYNNVKASLGVTLLDNSYNGEIEISGYPQNADGQLVRTHGKVKELTPFKIFYDNPTNPGHSGSPIMITRDAEFYTVGIHTHADELNYGTRITQGLLDRFNEWITY